MNDGIYAGQETIGICCRSSKIGHPSGAWHPLLFVNGGETGIRSRLTIETRPDHRDHPQTEATIQKYVALAKQHDLDPSQMALAFVNTRPFVSSTLIGATNMQQLKTNIDSIEVNLSQEVKSEIEKIRRDHPMPY